MNEGKRFSNPWIALVALCAAAAASAAATKPETLTDDDIRWRQNIGFNPQVHGTVANSGDAEVFARVPYAYYPSSNELEVGFDLTAACKLLSPGTARPESNPATLTVRVFPKDSADRLAEGTMPLDAKGRGHGRIKLPELPSGVYRVEYEFGGVKLASSRTFRRSHFEFERNSYGLEHKVYAPFTPVVVDGRSVSVVGRTYTLNAQGLFDSVIANGRELLAEPMKLVVETADGQRVEWKGGGWFGSGVKGNVVYPDLAEFETSAQSTICNLKSKISIEEDGCAKIALTLNPEPRTLIPIKRAWLEMALKEAEAPLCHMVGMNSMRHNYAGLVPRGGEIAWINQSWRPARFAVKPFAGEPPASYQVWEANNLMHWASQRWNFAPYIWLGAEERGLAWFGDHTQGYSTDGKRSIQRLFIEPGKVVLRVELIQKPVTLDAPHTFEFGLQASPTKPLRPNWRGYDVPGGGGMPVVVWGGFGCSDKYPVNKEWPLVEKIVAGRGSRTVDEGFFKAIEAKQHLEKAAANGVPWLKSVLQFAEVEANRPSPNGTTVYFEEHQTSGGYPEMIEYMDEWADTTWSRFRYFDYSGFVEGSLAKGTWGPEVRSANAPSYRDFAVWFANEWMRRGVGIYYDNTYPMVDYNREHFNDQERKWSSSLWGHRDYYKRVWKRSRELMEKGLTPLDPLYSKTDPTRRMRLNIVGHVTNCQVLPYTTWWDATLGVESPGPWVPAGADSSEWLAKALIGSEWPFIILPTPSKGAAGQALPYSPDYLRAMECGRMAGLIPHNRCLLRGEDAFGLGGGGLGISDEGQEPVVREHRYLSDAAMGLIHEIRGGAGNEWEHPQAGGLRRVIRGFGYGKPDVEIRNYWEENPFVEVRNPDVKWIAMKRQAPIFGLLLLQSYRADAATTRVKFPGAGFFMDALTRETFTADVHGEITVPLEADYGTRLLLAAKDAKEAHLLARTNDTLFLEDFEFGRGPGSIITGNPSIVADTSLPGNQVLRLTPAHPAQNLLFITDAAINQKGDYACEFKFRLPVAPCKAGKQGLFRVGYRHDKNRRYAFEVGLAAAADGTVMFQGEIPRLIFDGGKSQPLQSSTVTPGKGLSGGSGPSSTGWHTLAIKVQGQHHTLSLDGAVFFEGTDDVSLSGGLEIAPSWTLQNDSPVPLVEIDDIRVLKVSGRNP